VSGFKLTPKETTAENFQRILEGELDNIIRLCDSYPENIHKSIHEIRKCIKKTRAVLRLVRDEIGYSTYYRENAFYRDMGRSLSQIRSYNVLIETSRTLQSDLSATITENEIEPLINSIQIKRDKYLEILFLQGNFIGDISKQSGEAKKRIDDYSFKHDDFRAFKGGLLRIYRQGMKYRDLARIQPSYHNLHDLRKRMKYLWYHMLILQPIFPSMLDAYAKTLDSIGENLGIYHDFSELQLYLERHTGVIKDPINATLTEGCEFKKTSILNRTWNSIDTIYSEKPKAIAGRFSKYWETYRNEYQENTTNIK